MKMSKEVVMQQTIDFLYKRDPNLLDRIFKGRKWNKVETVGEKEMVYYEIIDE